MYELIEQLMKNKSISLSDLTKNTSVSQQQFSNWKTKKSKPSTETIKELAEYFGVPISYFFTGKLVDKNEDFSNEDLLLARELNKSDKIDLIKDIFKLQKESDVRMLKEMTKIFLERK